MVARDPAFWANLASPQLHQRVIASEPIPHAITLDDDYLDDVAAAFARVIDAKSPYTSGHSNRVALFSDLIAERIGMTKGDRRHLQHAALLHDIGKLGVSNQILDKPGKLDAEEWREMQRHTVLGEEILSRVAAFADFARIAGAHHERLDGSGYPRGLRAPDLDLATRIVTVADIFDALTADRPYRAAMPVARAFEIMAEEAGAKIDMRCFEALKHAIAVAEPVPA